MRFWHWLSLAFVLTLLLVGLPLWVALASDPSLPGTWCAPTETEGTCLREWIAAYAGWAAFVGAAAGFAVLYQQLRSMRQSGATDQLRTISDRLRPLSSERDALIPLRAHLELLAAWDFRGVSRPRTIRSGDPRLTDEERVALKSHNSVFSTPSLNGTRAAEHRIGPRQPELDGPRAAFDVAVAAAEAAYREVGGLVRDNVPPRSEQVARLKETSLATLGTIEALVKAIDQLMIELQAESDVAEDLARGRGRR